MIKIAVLGYGTVGSGVAEVIWTNQEIINKRVGEELEIKYILDLREFPGTPAEKLIVHDFEQIVNDEEIKIVVEVMGDTEKVVDSCMLAIGTATGLANIEHIIGIIILVIQLAWLTTKFIVKIINTVKNKQSLDTLDDGFGSIVDHLEKIENSLNSGEEFIENERHDTEQK